MEMKALRGTSKDSRRTCDPAHPDKPDKMMLSQHYLREHRKIADFHMKDLPLGSL